MVSETVMQRPCRDSSLFTDTLYIKHISNRPNLHAVTSNLPRSALPPCALLRSLPLCEATRLIRKEALFRSRGRRSIWAWKHTAVWERLITGGTSQNRRHCPVQPPIRRLIKNRRHSGRLGHCWLSGSLEDKTVFSLSRVLTYGSCLERRCFVWDSVLQAVLLSEVLPLKSKHSSHTASWEPAICTNAFQNVLMLCEDVYIWYAYGFYCIWMRVIFSTHLHFFNVWTYISTFIFMKFLSQIMNRSCIIYEMKKK